jgi:hypothetical protein
VATFRRGDLREDIQALVKGLEVVRIKDKATWHTIDVLVALANNTDTFFYVNNADFVVIVQNGTAWWVWCSYCESGDYYAKYMPEWLEIAKGLGIKTIGFNSSRKAYEKVAPLIGAEVVRTTYEIVVK